MCGTWDEMIAIVVGPLGTVPKGLGEETGDNWKSMGKSRPSILHYWDRSEFSEECKRPEEVGCQTPMKDSQLTLVWKLANNKGQTLLKQKYTRHRAEMSPGDLMRFAVTQAPVINHLLTLMWKTFKGVRVKTIQTTALSKSAWIPRRVQGICCHSNSGEKPPASAGGENP